MIPGDPVFSNLPTNGTPHDILVMTVARKDREFDGSILLPHDLQVIMQSVLRAPMPDAYTHIYLDEWEAPSRPHPLRRVLDWTRDRLFHLLFRREAKLLDSWEDHIC